LKPGEKNSSEMTTFAVPTRQDRKVNRDSAYKTLGGRRGGEPRPPLQITGGKGMGSMWQTQGNL